MPQSGPQPGLQPEPSSGPPPGPPGTPPGRTLLSPEGRARLAADPGLGGGNVLRSALSVAAHPDLPFIRSGRPLAACGGGARAEFSLRELDRLVQSWSAYYLGRGVRPRDRVAVYIEDSFAYSVHFHALAQIGAIGVLINSKAPPATALELCRRTGPVGLYTTESRAASLEPELSGPDGPRWTVTAEDLPAPPEAALPEEARFRHAPEDPVSILHSSGTTGIPKPAVQTHHSSIAGPRFRLTGFIDPPEAVMMAAQPQSHLGSVMYACYAILAGTPLVPLYDPTGAELAAAIAEHRPTTVMAFAHAYAELAETEVAPGALDSVDGWVTMGDAIHEAHLRSILAKRDPGLPPAVFYDRFGSTELGWGIMVHPRSLASPRDDRCVGRPDGVAEVAVLREDGTRAGPGEVGLFAARGPTITAGYWNDSDTTYRSRLAGYWLSGDLAYQDADGDFYQVDRAVDAIETSAGTAHSVRMEEFLLSELPAIADCAVVAGRHHAETVPVAVCAAVDPGVGAGELLAAANKALRAAGLPEIAVLEVVPSAADIPQGVTGKVLKRLLRGRYAALHEYLAGRDSAAVATTIELREP
ncbi:class I adenylate-forming enzyme family protein [Bailinhaonella thermotolerans]|uniref:Long-chain fatty acid--CoA ligase n=1 Tax=Bailinhaonella thermotolerans TaxID=1070861 RepID=A0A3A4B9E3_9ACTN|nr:class I adenylate-forming enzyme family protein [Bailinhaonella thermotolerans]RJL34334.1 long-chain fatty acid--CoA ligase [Bailinhaonella thermotolerans]